MTRSSEHVGAVEIVSTPIGDARVWWHPASRRARAVLVLGHGAGRGADTPDLLELAGRLPERGIAVALVDQPWVVAGRRVAGPPAQLDVAFLAVVPEVVRRLAPRAALVVGGRSAGARVACRTALGLGAAGVVALAFPLHLPGRPQSSRIDELAGAGVPTLVVQGDRDAFGGPEEVLEALAGGGGAGSAEVDVVALRWADHSLRVAARAPVTAAETRSAAVEAVGGWIRRTLG